MKRFLVIALLFMAAVVLNAKEECVCKKGEANCKCPALAQQAPVKVKSKIVLTKKGPVRITVKIKIVPRKVVLTTKTAKKTIKVTKIRIIKTIRKIKVIQRRIVKLRRMEADASGNQRIMLSVKIKELKVKVRVLKKEVRRKRKLIIIIKRAAIRANGKPIKIVIPQRKKFVIVKTLSGKTLIISPKKQKARKVEYIIGGKRGIYRRPKVIYTSRGKIIITPRTKIIVIRTKYGKRVKLLSRRRIVIDPTMLQEARFSAAVKGRFSLALRMPTFSTTIKYAPVERAAMAIKLPVVKTSITYASRHVKVLTRKIRKLQIVIKRTNAQLVRLKIRYREAPVRAKMVIGRKLRRVRRRLTFFRSRHYSYRRRRRVIRRAIRIARRTRTRFVKIPKIKKFMKIKSRCKDLNVRLAKSAKRVVKLTAMITKHCSKIGMVVPDKVAKIIGMIRRTLKHSKTLAKELPPSYMRRRYYRGRIRPPMFGPSKIKSPAIHKCRRLQRQLAESAARAKLLERRFEKHCKKALGVLPEPIGRKLFKLKGTLRGIKRRSYFLRRYTMPRYRFRIGRGVSRKARIIKISIKRTERRIAKLRRAMIHAPPEVRMSLRRKIRKLKFKRIRLITKVKIIRRKRMPVPRRFIINRRRFIKKTITKKILKKLLRQGKISPIIYRKIMVTGRMPRGIRRMVRIVKKKTYLKKRAFIRRLVMRGVPRGAIKKIILMKRIAKAKHIPRRILIRRLIRQGVPRIAIKALIAKKPMRPLYIRPAPKPIKVIHLARKERKLHKKLVKTVVSVKKLKNLYAEECGKVIKPEVFKRTTEKIDHAIIGIRRPIKIAFRRRHRITPNECKILKRKLKKVIRTLKIMKVKYKRECIRRGRPMSPRALINYRRISRKIERTQRRLMRLHRYALSPKPPRRHYRGMRPPMMRRRFRRGYIPRVPLVRRIRRIPKPRTIRQLKKLIIIEKRQIRKAKILDRKARRLIYKLKIIKRTMRTATPAQRRYLRRQARKIIGKVRRIKTAIRVIRSNVIKIKIAVRRAPVLRLKNKRCIRLKKRLYAAMLVVRRLIRKVKAECKPARL